MEFQQILDHDNLEEARSNLNEFTGKLYKKRYEREIHMTDIENLIKDIDNAQMGFINENPELSFEEIRLIKKFSDYIKGID